MKIYDIDNLFTSNQQLATSVASGVEINDSLYDFFQPTFQMMPNHNIIESTVLPENEMRIDLVTNSIYNTTEYLDFLLSFNDIDNPLNIMEGDIIFHTDFQNIENFRVKTSQNTNARNTLLNANKVTKIDPSRQAFVEQDYSLPPTFNETPQPSITIDKSRSQMIIQ
jgi:hypothetical protein